MPKSTVYKVVLIPDAANDFESLDGSIKKHALIQLKKLSLQPDLGEPCGNKYGLNLTSFRKLNFAKNAYRIVYKIDAPQLKVQVWGIGKRESEKIYRMVESRISNPQLKLHQSISFSGTADRRKKPRKRRDAET